jgi:uncharacterized protein DUF87
MDLERQLSEFRALRRQLEEAILPYATSVDGRGFSLQASLHALAFEAGGYVVLEEDGTEPRLGQLLSLDATSTEGPEFSGDGGLRTKVMLRAAEGVGVVLAGDGRPFHDALARPATPDEVRAHLEATAPRRARLAVGELALAPGVPLTLDAGGFDRHSFLCGQSGSGKTYALGVVLERLLHETELRIVILDPNSDFVRLGEARDDADATAMARHGEIGSGVLVRRAGEGPDRLALRAVDIGPELLAAALRLDPIADREEYAVLLDFAEHGVASVEELVAGDSPIAKRARNLGAAHWGVWARGEQISVLNDLEGDARCLVVDLGSLPTRDEQRLVAAAVLSTLWRERERRQPVLIVMDEAHNVCPAEPDDPLTALSTELAVRIAAEGRKFGLYLLVSTQRPQKVAENALTQCDNLFLMRMNSRADLAFVGDVFSFVPPGLLARATDFAQGECLVAGKVAPHPAFLRIGARVTHEGGGDVPADWAAARTS